MNNRLLSMSASSQVIALRQLLAERFSRPTLGEEASVRTGLPALDEMELPRAALVELVSSAASPGTGLLLYGLLHALLPRGERVALIDGNDSFAPKGLPQADLDRLLWIRCRAAGEAIKAADLAVRDGNVGWIILFLTLNSAPELRRIPATAWHRLQMLAEKSAVTLLAFTPQAQVGCARLRLAVSGTFPLTALHRRREELLPGLRLQVERRRGGSGTRGLERSDDEEIRRPVCA
jgi:hypothetical protein